MQQNTTMNVLVSSNESYLKPLMVALHSLFENTNAEQICVYFINVSLRADQIQWLREKIMKYPRCSFHCIEVDQSIFGETKIFAHFSIEIYSRLLLMRLLPQNVARILWLDADTVVHNNIDCLYNMDLDGHSLVACESINQNVGKLRLELNLPDNQKYFNSGILLFNLEYLRQYFPEDVFMKFAHDNMDKIQWPDQDVLNAVCGSSALIIDYHKYNYMHFASRVFNENELIFITNNNCILHYIGPVKPWNYEFRCKTFQYWKHYALSSGIYSYSFFLKRDLLHLMQNSWCVIRRFVRIQINRKGHKD